MASGLRQLDQLDILDLRSFNAKQGFGFIENSEAFAIFGRTAEVCLRLPLIFATGHVDSGTSSSTRHRLATSRLELRPRSGGQRKRLVDPSLAQVTYTVEMNKFGMPQAGHVAAVPT